MRSGHRFGWVYRFQRHVLRDSELVRPALGVSSLDLGRLRLRAAIFLVLFPLGLWFGLIYPLRTEVCRVSLACVFGMCTPDYPYARRGLESTCTLDAVVACNSPFKLEAAVSATKILWGQILIVSSIVLITIWGATQWTAWRLAYQPQLGMPWAHLAGIPLYPPRHSFCGGIGSTLMPLASLLRVR